MYEIFFNFRGKCSSKKKRNSEGVDHHVEDLPDNIYSNTFGKKHSSEGVDRHVDFPEFSEVVVYFLSSGLTCFMCMHYYHALRQNKIVPNFADMR